MTSYGRVKSSTKPSYMKITAASVIISTNITECEETVDDTVVTKYEYDCVVYNKDEYLSVLAISTNQIINKLSDELETVKALLETALGTIVEWNNTNSYQIGAKVRYSGKIWESTVANNIWAPGTYGWIEINI